MEKIFFREVQKFGQWWLWILILGASASVIIPYSLGMYSQIVLGKPWGDKPMSDTSLLLTSFFAISIMVALILLFIFMKLITEIRSDGIWYRFPPILWKWRCIRKEEIEHFEVRRYNAIAEYGGYGIRWGFGRRTGKALNVSGNTGLQLYLYNGKKILFGTQKKQAIEYAMNKLTENESKV